ncbi:MAG: hypothetical protein JRM77_09040 [Nitrososphaerota archaeon]|nr:hypothetical protein [Nitrososphaerota archaeon]
MGAFSIAGIYGIFYVLLDKIVSPVDKGDTKRGDLDQMESDIVARYFVPTAKDVDHTARSPSQDDIRALKTGYNAMIRRIERAQYAGLRFERFNRHLSRSVASAGCFMVPIGSIFTFSPVPSGTPLLVVMVALLGWCASSGLAVYLLWVLRNLREDFKAATWNLKNQLAAKLLSDSERRWADAAG